MTRRIVLPVACWFVLSSVPSGCDTERGTSEVDAGWDALDAASRDDDAGSNTASGDAAVSIDAGAEPAADGSIALADSGSEADATPSTDAAAPSTDAGAPRDAFVPSLVDAFVPVDPRGPRVLSMTAAPDTVTPASGAFTVTAVVTDPDGTADLLGGTLIDVATGRTYGAFSATSPGTFTATSSWSALNSAVTIDLPSGGATRVLRGVFFDVAGHRAEQEISISLACTAREYGACGGVCQACAVPSGGTVRCAGTSCVRSCDDPRGHVCANACVSRDDVASCGDRCSPCPSPANGVATCDGTTCDFVCNPGYHRCGARCESDSSATACGALCTRCETAAAHATNVCVEGACDFTCNHGFHRCGDTCVTNFWPDTCGTRCTPCEFPPHSSPTCDGTACGFTCDFGYHACGAPCVPDDGAASCGSRCTPCPTSPHGVASCDGGECQLSCSPGYSLCGEGTASPTCCLSHRRFDVATVGSTAHFAKHAGNLYMLSSRSTSGSSTRIELFRWSASGWGSALVGFNDTRYVYDFTIDASGMGYGALVGATYDGMRVARFSVLSSTAPTFETPAVTGTPSGAPFTTTDSTGAVVLAVSAIRSAGEYLHVLRRGSDGVWARFAPEMGFGARTMVDFALDASDRPWLLSRNSFTSLGVVRYDGSMWTAPAVYADTMYGTIVSGSLGRAPDGTMLIAFSSASNVYYTEAAATGSIPAPLNIGEGDKVRVASDASGRRYIAHETGVYVGRYLAPFTNRRYGFPETYEGYSGYPWVFQRDFAVDATGNAWLVYTATNIARTSPYTLSFYAVGDPCSVCMP